MAKNDEVTRGKLVKATCPAKGQAYVFPDNIFTIGENAFTGWGWGIYDEPMSIPEGVVIIGSFAFDGMRQFNSAISIPNSVKVIERHSFDGWEKFNQPFKLPSIAFMAEHMMDGWKSFNQPFIIPDSVTEIESGAMRNWHSFNHNINLPIGLKKLGNGSFLGWKSYKKDNVTRDSNGNIYRFDKWYKDCFNKWGDEKSYLAAMNARLVDLEKSLEEIEDEIDEINLRKEETFSDIKRIREQLGIKE